MISFDSFDTPIILKNYFTLEGETEINEDCSFEKFKISNIFIETEHEYNQLHFFKDFKLRDKK